MFFPSPKFSASYISGFLIQEMKFPISFSPRDPAKDWAKAQQGLKGTQRCLQVPLRCDTPGPCPWALGALVPLGFCAPASDISSDPARLLGYRHSGPRGSKPPHCPAGILWERQLTAPESTAVWAQRTEKHGRCWGACEALRLGQEEGCSLGIQKQLAAPRCCRDDWG